VLDAEVRLAAARGVTVVIASHELDRAGGLASRTVTIAGGHAREADRVA
jgi:ABC-type polar amino acid transport system ATPase subunit